MKIYRIISTDMNDDDFNEWMCDECRGRAPEGADAFFVSVAEVCPYCGREDGVEE